MVAHARVASLQNKLQKAESSQKFCHLISINVKCEWYDEIKQENVDDRAKSMKETDPIQLRRRSVPTGS